MADDSKENKEEEKREGRMKERKKERIVENEAKAGGRWERTGKLDR